MIDERSIKNELPHDLHETNLPHKELTNSSLITLAISRLSM